MEEQLLDYILKAFLKDSLFPHVNKSTHFPAVLLLMKILSISGAFVQEIPAVPYGYDATSKTYLGILPREWPICVSDVPRSAITNTQSILSSKLIFFLLHSSNC